jgi:hypothetical protein
MNILRHYFAGTMTITPLFRTISATIFVSYIANQTNFVGWVGKPSNHELRWAICWVSAKLQPSLVGCFYSFQKVLIPST